MTYHDDFTLSAALLEQGSLEQLSTQGLGALPAAAGGASSIRIKKCCSRSFTCVTTLHMPWSGRYSASAQTLPQ